MKLLVVLLTLAFVVAVPLLARRGRASHPRSSAQPTASCALGDRCTLLCDEERLVNAPEYYDDEELDAFRGTPSDRYTPEQVAAFEEVLLSMRPAEVHGWLLALQRRGVELPDVLKDEAFLLVNE